MSVRVLSFWDHTYIDRSLSFQFVFSSSWNHTYIDRSSSCQFEFPFFGSHLYRSANFLSICVWFELGPHLYRSIIVWSVWVWVFETAPISIDHCLVDWVESCSSSSRTYLVKSCLTLSYTSFFEFILSEDRSFLILLIIESFIIS